MSDPGKPVPVSSANGLLSFSGRYSRKTFWLWSLALLGLLVLMLLPLAAMNNPTGGSGGPAVLLLLAIPLLWLYCKLIVHRLHDLGWSGWWFLLLGPLMIPLPLWMMHETHAVYLRIEQSYAAQQAIKPYVSSLQYGALLLFVGGFVLMGCLRGTRGPNRYGPDPTTP